MSSGPWVPPDEFFAPVREPEKDVSILDPLRQLGEFAGTVGSGVAGALKYIPGLEDNEALESAQTYFEEGNKSLRENMSPGYRRALESSVLPDADAPDMWDQGVSHALAAAGTKTLGMAPWIVTSIFPAAWAARAAAAAGATRATAAGVAATAGAAPGAVVGLGETFNRFQGEIAKMPDDQLQEENSYYAALRQSMDEEQARAELSREVAGVLPLAVGAAELAIGRFGAEGFIAGALAGARSTAGAAGRAGAAGLAEGSTEGLIEGGTEFAGQTGERRIKPGQAAPYDWRKIGEAAAEGALPGTLVGAATGVVTGRQVDPDVEVALNERVIPPAPVARPVVNPAAPPVNPAGSPPVVPEASPTPAPEADPTARRAATLAADPVLTPPTATADVDQIAALTAGTAPAQPTPTPGATAAPIAAVVENPAQFDPMLGDLDTEGDLPAGVTAPPVDVNAPATGVPSVPPVPEQPLTPAQQTLTQQPAPVEGVLPSAPATVEPPSPAPASDGVVAGAGPRVLRDEVQAAKEARRADILTRWGDRADSRAAAAELRRQEAEQAERVAQGKTAVVAPERQRTGGRISNPELERVVRGAAAVQTLETDPAKFGQKADREKVYQTAERIAKTAEKLGVEVPAEWKTILDLKAGMKGQSAAKNPEWMAARTALAERAAAAPERARGGNATRANKQSAAEVRAEKLKGIVQGIEYSPDLIAMKPSAMRNYIKTLLTSARAQGIAAPKRVDADQDDFVAHLANARGLENSADPTRLQAFMANDFALRQGDTEMVKQYRKAEAKKAAGAGGVDGGYLSDDKDKAKELDQAGEFSDEFPADTDDSGSDRTEIADRAEGARPALSVVKDEGTSGAAEPEVYQEVEARDRPAVETSPDDVKGYASRGDAIKAGAIKVETRKNRSVTPKGKGFEAVQRVAARRDIQLTPAYTEGKRTPQTDAQAVEFLKNDLVATNVDQMPMPAAWKAALAKRTAPPPRRSWMDDAQKTTLDKALKSIKLGRLNEKNREMVAFFRDRVAELAGNVPVYIVDRAGFVASDSGRSTYDDVAAGYWDREAQHIVLLDETLTDPDFAAHVIVHEGSHAALQKVISGNPTLHQQVVEMMKIMEDNLDDRAFMGTLEEGFKRPYGLKNAHEFIAEIMSNPDFQRRAAEIELTRDEAILFGLPLQKRSLWDAFVSTVRKAFGIDPGKFTLLDAALRVTQDLTVARAEGNFKGEGGGANYSAVDQLSLSELREEAGDTANAFVAKRQRWALAARTLDQIRQHFPGLFPGRNGDALESLVATVQEMQQFVNGLTREGNEYTAKFEALRRKDPDEAARAAKVAITFTMNEQNPVNRAGATQADLEAANPHMRGTMKWAQARAQLQRNQDAFMALKPETRELLLDASGYFRKTQNDSARARAANILDIHKGLSDSERQRIITHVVQSDLTSADKDILKDDALFEALKQTRQMRVLNGMYFPLMRHGNIVVRAKAKIGNTMGGRLIGDDVLAFRGKDLKEAQEKAARYTNAPHALDVTSSGTMRILRSTGQELSAVNAKGQDVDVEVRIRLQRQATWFFEGDKAAWRFRRELGDQFEDIKGPEPKRDEGIPTDLMPVQVQALVRNIKARQDISDNQKELLAGSVQESALRLMTGNRIQQRAIARRNVYGASEDLARNMAQYAVAHSRYQGVLEYMPKIHAALDEMEEVASKTSDKLSGTRRNVVNEMKKRLTDQTRRSVVNIAGPSTVVQDIFTLSYLDKLFSPAYSVINGMQPWMVTAPYLGGIYGNVHAGAAMGRAYSTIGALGVTSQGISNTAKATANVLKTSIDTRDTLGSIRKNVAKASDGQALLDVLNMAEQRGAFDDPGMEIASSVAAGRGAWGRGLSKVDRIARQLPTVIENVNRSVTLIAAYRLAKNQPGATHEQARDFAFNTMQSTQGDYSAANQPAFFNNPVLRPMLQFQKYAQMMLSLLGDMIQRAGFSNAEKRQASKQLLNIVGMQILMAGALGLPGLQLLKVALLITSLMGGAEYDDFERWARETIAKGTGEPLAEYFTKGFSRLAGIDISSRVGLSDIGMPFGEPKTADKEGVAAYLFRFIGGAPVGLAMEWGSGIGKAAEGEFGKAFELMVPNKFIADTKKAVTGYNDRDLTMPEAVAQAAGFRPRSAAEKGDKIGAGIDKRDDFAARAKQLSQAYINAKTKGELAKIKSQIIEHNKTPGVEQKQKVFPGGLDHVRAKKEAERRAHTGRTE